MTMARKAQYREMLDQQIKQKNQYKAYGNMTQIEKAMNKDDLKAWKNYDNTQYSLIPGVNSVKRTMVEKMQGALGEAILGSSPKKVRNFEEI